VQCAAGALSRIVKGSLRRSTVHFSLRVPACETMIVGSANQGRAPDAVTMLSFAHVETSDSWAAHRAIYRLRPDVGAIVTARLPWASRLARLALQMPALFDEQARHLGTRVQLITMSGAEIEAASVSTVRHGGNAFLLGEYAVCLGVNHHRVIFNAELLEKCTHAYVLAILTGLQVRQIPYYARAIAGRRLRADQKRAASDLACGKVPSDSSSY